MRPCLTAILSVVFTIGLAAQSRQAGTEPVDTPASGVLFSQAAAQAPPQPTTPSRPPARRRSSMVGYIDDASIESRLRVRFDAASGNTAPDRAEFFYAKCGCFTQLDPAHVYYDPDAPGPREGAASDVRFQQLNVWGEYAFGNFVSVFGQLPVRWLQPQSFIAGTGPGFSDHSGLGDLRAGAKIGFAPAVDQTLTAQVQFHFPTGDASKGLGTDHASVEPGLLYQVHLAERATIESQFGIWLPFGGSAGVPISVDEDFSGRVLTYGIGSGFDLLNRGSVQLGPVVELVGWRVLGGYQAVDIDADGTNIVNLKIGGRLSLAGNSIYVGYGFALTDEVWYDDILRFEYRYQLGGR
jgi:hypothetical protein